MPKDNFDWLFGRLVRLEFEVTRLKKQVEGMMTQEEVVEVLCSYFVDCEGMNEDAAYLKAAQCAAVMFAEGKAKAAG